MNKLFLSALPIIEKIEKAGYQAYFVGGSVRDHLLEREIHDIDIASSATPAELKALFPATVDVGIEHGTILIIHERTGFEVTTFRTESDYQDFRRPDSVTFIRSLHEDLKRRDFTMNAIAMDRAGKLIDPFDGQLALKNQLIQTVGAADERFKEDALRIMRAIRFVSQLGFQLDQQTEEALTHYGSLLQHIAIERIASEMVRLLEGEYKERALKLALSSRLYAYLPSLLNDGDVLKKSLEYTFESLSEPEMWLLFLALSDHADPASELKKWRLPARKIKRLTMALSILQGRMDHDWTSYQLYSAGKDIGVMVEVVYRTLRKDDIGDAASNIDKQYSKLVITSKDQLAISGKICWNGSKNRAGHGSRSGCQRPKRLF